MCARQVIYEGYAKYAHKFLLCLSAATEGGGLTGH